MSTIQTEEHGLEFQEERWELSPQGEQLAGAMLQLMREGLRSPQRCPQDHTLGNYCGIGGTLQQPVSLYRCANGHIFSWHPRQRQAIMRPSGWASAEELKTVPSS